MRHVLGLNSKPVVTQNLDQRDGRARARIERDVPDLSDRPAREQRNRGDGASRSDANAGNEAVLVRSQEFDRRHQPEVNFTVVEKAREEISTRILKRRSTNEELGTVTISTGIAESVRGEQPVMLIERADGALYAAKRNGRNRTAVADKNTESQAA